MTKQFITKNTMISEIVEKYPAIAEVLTMDYGFHCMGCFGADLETIEQGASAHGMTEEEVEDMLKIVNTLVIEAKESKPLAK